MPCLPTRIMLEDGGLLAVVSASKSARFDHLVRRKGCFGMYSIETLLSARLFLVPQQWGTRLYFVSNLGQRGHLSLYAMEAGGSVPEPLLPPHIALQNPTLLESDVFTVYPSLGKILVILDQDGDENYQPMLIPLEGGLPELAFGDRFVGYRVRCLKSDPARNLAYLHAESSQTSLHEAYQANLESGTLLKLGESTWENAVMGFNARHTRVTLLDVYGAGDDVLYEW